MPADPSAATARLLAIMARLRDPEGGCPWDQEQTFATIAPYTIEEAYEVEDAIVRGDMAALKDELGDLLLQVVFHARMAEEAGLFSFADVAAGISEKLVRRHPHVFGNVTAETPVAVMQNWESIKAAERAARTESLVGTGEISPVLAGVTNGLPGLTRAVKLQNRAARVGFDWPDKGPVILKIKEELQELEEEIKSDQLDKVEEEFGDFLFVVANLARHLKLDPEAAMRRANRKFINRFSKMESILKQEGKKLEDVGLETMDAAWNKAKEMEKAR